MITKIKANGSSDINILLVSPAPAPWANAGVISIRTVLVKREWTGSAAAPIVHTNKFGRNDVVTVKRGDEVQTLKYKKAEQLLAEGWEIVPE